MHAVPTARGHHYRTCGAHFKPRPMCSGTSTAERAVYYRTSAILPQSSTAVIVELGQVSQPAETPWALSRRGRCVDPEPVSIKKRTPVSENRRFGYPGREPTVKGERFTYSPS